MFSKIVFSKYEISKETADSEILYMEDGSLITKAAMDKIIEKRYKNHKGRYEYIHFLIDQVITGKSCTFKSDYMQEHYFFDLLEIIIPDTITEIGDYAFSNCKNLYSVKLPANLISIGERAFARCKQLDTMGVDEDCDICLPKTLKYIGIEAFAWCNFKEIVLNRGIKTIDKRAFIYNRDLEKIKISATIREIKRECFQYCTNLKEVNILGGITKLSSGLFSHCESMEKFRIPKTVTMLEGSVFNNCHNLKRLTITKNVTRYNDKFHHNCHKLKIYYR